MRSAMIGTSPLRKEDDRLLRGRGRFLDDVTRPGMLALGVVRSTHGHARIRAVDLTAARSAPGVLAAWSAADLPETARGIAGAQKGRAYALAVLARDVVRFVGEPVAVVVADDAYRLADALDGVAVDYEPLPAMTTPAASRTGLPLLSGWPDNAAVLARGGTGDAERGLRDADVVIDETFRHARLAATPIETRGTAAWRDPDSGVL